MYFKDTLLDTLPQSEPGNVDKEVESLNKTDIQFLRSNRLLAWKIFLGYVQEEHLLDAPEGERTLLLLLERSSNPNQSKKQLLRFFFDNVKNSSTETLFVIQWALNLVSRMLLTHCSCCICIISIQSRLSLSISVRNFETFRLKSKSLFSKRFYIKR